MPSIEVAGGHDCERQAASGSNAIEQSAEESLSKRIRYPEGDHDIGVIAVGPVVLELQVGSQQREGLPVNVIDNSGGKEDCADPPA